VTIAEKLEAIARAEAAIEDAKTARNNAIKALLISSSGDEVLEDGEVAIASSTSAYAAVNGSIVLMKPRFFAQFPSPTNP
jgi:hypothetical protein